MYKFFFEGLYNKQWLIGRRLLWSTFGTIIKELVAQRQNYWYTGSWKMLETFRINYIIFHRTLILCISPCDSSADQGCKTVTSIKSRRNAKYTGKKCFACSFGVMIFWNLSNLFWWPCGHPNHASSLFLQQP